MKEIYGPATHDTDLSNQDVIAYLVKDVSDVLALVARTKKWADLDVYTDEEVLNDHLTEFGERPTGEPVIVVVNSNDERNYLEFVYITRKMFEA